MSGNQYSEGTVQQRDALFRLLVESVRDYAIFLLDPKGHILTWNEGARRLKQYEADEIIGQHFSIFYPPEEVIRGKPAHALQVAQEEGRWEDESWRIRKDGTHFWANVVITALRNADGQLIGFAKVTRDLTERKRAEEERLHLVEAAQRARQEAEVTAATLRARDEFLSVAAHELKTPMTSLHLAAQLLLRRLDRGDTPDMLSLHRSVRTIDQQVDKLARLVSHLLETTRHQAGRMELQRIRTNLAEIVKSVSQQAQARTNSHHLALAVIDPLWGFVDGLRFEQVVTNLLDNAIKFSPAGNRVDIELSRPAPNTARLVVRDRGLGVPPEHRPHLFERFYQAHAGDYRSGMGLGLFISRQIVELHGGQIRAEFPADGGSRFIVELPTDVEEEGSADGKGVA